MVFFPTASSWLSLIIISNSTDTGVNSDTIIMVSEIILPYPVISLMICVRAQANENIPQATTNGGTVETLSDEAIQFAHRMFNAARHGDAVLLQAVDAGLPANMTNDEGLSEVPVTTSPFSLLYDPLGNTLLMLAAYNGHADLTRGLVDRGADVNRINDRGQSPLAGVVFKGYDEIAILLAEKGANPRLGMPTAIQTARMFNKTQLLTVLGATEDDMNDAVPLTPGPPPPSS